MDAYPKIRSVVPVEKKQLLVTFETGEQKLYNCTPLLAEEPFRLLQNEAFFKAVQVDAGGYGICWNDKIDLSESELWLHGEPVDTVMDRTSHAGDRSAHRPARKQAP